MTEHRVGHQSGHDESSRTKTKHFPKCVFAPRLFRVFQNMQKQPIKQHICVLAKNLACVGNKLLYNKAKEVASLFSRKWGCREPIHRRM